MANRANEEWGKCPGRTGGLTLSEIPSAFAPFEPAATIVDAGRVSGAVAVNRAGAG